MNSIDFNRWFESSTQLFKDKVLRYLSPCQQKTAFIGLGILTILSLSILIYRRWTRKVSIVRETNSQIPSIVQTNLSSGNSDIDRSRIEPPSAAKKSVSNVVSTLGDSVIFQIGVEEPARPTNVEAPQENPLSSNSSAIPLLPTNLPSVKSPEEIHLEEEKNRLKRDLQERANPNRFYIFKEPPISLKEALFQSKLLVGQLREMYRSANATEKVLEMEQEAQKIELQLRGKRIASMNPLKSDLMIYTNNELKWLIGCYYKSIEETLEEDACYKNLKLRPIIKQVTEHFDLLHQQEHLSEFKSHQADWTVYLKKKSIHIKSMIKLLKNRLENPIKEKEPVYEPISYEEPKKLREEQKTNDSSATSNKHGEIIWQGFYKAIARVNLRRSEPPISPSKLKRCLTENTDKNVIWEQSSREDVERKHRRRNSEPASPSKLALNLTSIGSSD